MFYTIVISILSQTLFAITRIWDYRIGFPGHVVSSQLQFHTVYQKEKRMIRYFIRAIHFPPSKGGLDSTACLVSLEVPGGVQDRQQTGGKN